MGSMKAKAPIASRNLVIPMRAIGITASRLAMVFRFGRMKPERPICADMKGTSKTAIEMVKVQPTM